MNEEETKEKEPEKNEDELPPEKSREIYWVIGVMVGLVLIFFAASSIFQSFKTLNYEGLTFTKEYFGEIPIYKYSYNSIITGSATGGQTRPVHLVLRGDPRENNIPIDGEIEFPRGKTIYLGINETGIRGCEYSLVAAASLSSFISSNGLSILAGTVNKTEANELSIDYVTCEEYPENSVIIIQGGVSTSISKNRNCYTIRATNCEILPAVEKFEVQALIDARKRAGL